MRLVVHWIVTLGCFTAFSLTTPGQTRAERFAPMSNIYFFPIFPKSPTVGDPATPGRNLAHQPHGGASEINPNAQVITWTPKTGEVIENREISPLDVSCEGNTATTVTNADLGSVIGSPPMIVGFPSAAKTTDTLSIQYQATTEQLWEQREAMFHQRYLQRATELHDKLLFQTNELDTKGNQRYHDWCHNALKRDEEIKHQALKIAKLEVHSLPLIFILVLIRII